MRLGRRDAGPQKEREMSKIAALEYGVEYVGHEGVISRKEGVVSENAICDARSATHSRAEASNGIDAVVQAERGVARRNPGLETLLHVTSGSKPQEQMRDADRRAELSSGALFQKLAAMGR